jgi:aldehyde dehydrogenase (NAD(P)+)
MPEQLERSLDTRSLDRSVEVLRERKDAWARLPLAAKLEHIRRMRPRVAHVAERWVAAAVAAKRIEPGSPWAGEEWTSGPYALLYGLNALERTLSMIARGESPLPRPSAIRTRRGGQVVVEVFPANAYDRLILNGLRAEVWMQPGVTRENLRAHVASFYRDPPDHGAVALVLGAGNIASIAPLDVLHELYGGGKVVLLKMNPVNDYLGPFFESVFADLVEEGFVRFAYGGADVGAYLAQHPGVDTIHITGSEKTYDAIRWGPGAEGAARKRRRDPVNTKPITAELGGVGPTIVLPGPWTDADVAFQAEHIATQKLHNAGFNCIASQVLVLPEAWPKSAALLDALRAVLRRLPPRAPYYPGADRRQAEAVRAHPGAELIDAPGAGVVPRTLITGLDPEDAACYGFNEEFFGGVLAQTSLPGGDALAFLREAVRFSNERLRGTLGANLIVHPETLEELGPSFEDAIADLRYGTIGVNSWVGVAFLLAEATWGAFPGHADEDIQSGRGVVHNAFLFDRPERTVVYAPFEPFHRALRRGRVHLAPKPPWFVTHRNAEEVGRKLTRFAASPSPLRLPGLFRAALRG